MIVRVGVMCEGCAGCLLLSAEFWSFGMGRFLRDVYSMLVLMCGRWAGFGQGIYNDHFDTFFLNLLLGLWV